MLIWSLLILTIDLVYFQIFGVSAKLIWIMWFFVVMINMYTFLFKSKTKLQAFMPYMPLLATCIEESYGIIWPQRYLTQYDALYVTIMLSLVLMNIKEVIVPLELQWMTYLTSLTLITLSISQQLVTNTHGVMVERVRI